MQPAGIQQNSQVAPQDGMNIDGRIVPFRNDAQRYAAYGPIPRTPQAAPVQQKAPLQQKSPYVLNDPLSAGIRGGVQNAENAIGQGLYKTFPNQTGFLNKLADFGQTPVNIPGMLGNGVRSIGNAAGLAGKLGGAFVRNLTGQDIPGIVGKNRARQSALEVKK